MASKVLSIAGEKVATFTALSDDKVIISDVYDLTNYDVLAAFRHKIAEVLQDFTPDLIACDMHPDLLSTRVAEYLSKEKNIPLQRIRHHHAHIAAVLAEHNYFSKPCLGFALDGYGYGENNEAWGGELLYVNGKDYRRIGRLKPLRLIGKDAAVKDTKLLKYAFLYDRLGETEFLKKNPDIPALLLQNLKGNINCTESSSCGRLFDLACELCNIKGDTPLARILNFEKAATKPKADLQGYKAEKVPYKNGGELWQADLTPLLLKAEEKQDDFANLFHGTLAKAFCETAEKAAASIPKINTVVLAGGCILNKKLTATLCDNLEKAGFAILQNKKLSPSDSSVSFGMAHIGKMYL